MFSHAGGKEGRRGVDDELLKAEASFDQSQQVPRIRFPSSFLMRFHTRSSLNLLRELRFLGIPLP